MPDSVIVERASLDAKAGVATLAARLESIRLGAAETAVVVIDMQNAYILFERYRACRDAIS